MPSAAELTARALSHAQVDVVFGLPGIHNIALWPALAAEQIRVIGSRHEQGTAYAADGYARATGRVGVALTTTGPGAANTLGAVGEAWASRVPIVVLCSDIPSHGRRPGVHRGFVHECRDQAALFAPVTKAALVVESAEEMPEAITTAIETALTPPTRPVYVQFPTDFLNAAVVSGARRPRIPDPSPAPAEQIGAASSLLGRCARPIIWAGGGARRAAQELDDLARRLGAPVITTFQARGVLAPDNPLLVPLPPHEPSVISLISEADAVVLVGTDLDPTTTQEFRTPLPPRRIAINLDGADATKNYEASVVIEADAAAGLAAIAKRVPQRAPWARDLGLLRSVLLEAMSGCSDRAEAAEFLRAVDQVLPEDVVVFADMAIPGYWMSAYLQVHRQRGLHFPMGWGTLGFSLPAAVGAAVAGERVTAFMGDGGALFAIGELATMAQERLPLTLVIFDDGGYGVLRYGHKQPPELSGTELLVPDFAMVGRGFGLAARSVTGVGDEFRAALAAAVASGEPNVLLTRTRLYPPPTASPMWPQKAAGVAPDSFLRADVADFAPVREDSSKSAVQEAAP